MTDKAEMVERKMTFPDRVRRMKPDHFDRVSGAWQRCLDEATSS